MVNRGHRLQLLEVALKSHSTEDLSVQRVNWLSFVFADDDMLKDAVCAECFQYKIHLGPAVLSLHWVHTQIEMVLNCSLAKEILFMKDFCCPETY